MKKIIIPFPAIQFIELPGVTVVDGQGGKSDSASSHVALLLGFDKAKSNSTFSVEKPYSS